MGPARMSQAVARPEESMKSPKRGGGSLRTSSVPEEVVTDVSSALARDDGPSRDVGDARAATGARRRRHPLSAEHRRFMGWLCRDKAPWPEAVVAKDAYAPEARLAAQRIWTRRQRNEHASAAVFARLVPRLMASGVGIEFCTMATKAAADELHHGELCARVVSALGGTPVELGEVPTSSLPNHAGCNVLESTLRHAMFVGCLAETVAVAFTAEEREQTTEPYVRRVITQISSDEVHHARFGWALAEQVVPTLAGAQRDALSRWLRVAFAYLEREEMTEVPLVAPPSVELAEQGKRIGVCDNRETRTLFYETVSTVIVPGLEALGLAAKDAWRERGNAPRA